MFPNRSKEYLAGCVSLIWMLALASAAQGQDYMIRASGVWQCSSQGAVVPLAGAHVDLINADIDIDTAGTNWDDHQMHGAQAAGFTDSTGHYTLIGYGSHDWPFGEKPNVYVIVSLNDGFVRLANQLNQDFSVNTRQDIHKQVGQKGQTVDIDIGTWTLGKGGEIAPPGQIPKANANPSECELWGRARDAVLDYEKITLGVPPPAGRYGIEYYWVWAGTPWTDVATTHWGPASYPILPTIIHEFGHSVRQAFDDAGDDLHFADDALKYIYGQMHSACYHSVGAFPSQFAFNEGWAEYWAGQTGITCAGNPANMEYEGNVAHALQILSNCAGAGTAFGKGAMLDVLKSAPKQIHTFGEFVQHAPWASQCAGSPGSSTGTTSSPLAQLNWQNQLTNSQPQVSWISGVLRTLGSLQQDLRRQMTVQRAAIDHAPPCLTENCTGMAIAVLRPVGTQAAIDVTALFQARIARMMSPPRREDLQRQLQSGEFAKTARDDKRAFLFAVAQTRIRALERAVAALGPLERSSADVARFIGRLREEIASTRALLQRGDLPALLMQPPGFFGGNIVQRTGRGPNRALAPSRE